MLYFLSVFILLLSIFGAITNNTIVLLFLPCYIIVFVGYLFFANKYKTYSFVLYCVSLAVILQTTLLSKYITGSDIIIEHFLHNTIISQAYWNPSVPDLYNSSLALTIFSPISSILLGLDGIWIFKIFMPAIFSLVPVVLYHMYKDIVGKSIAFLSAIFFIITPVFFLEMPTVIRQQIATLLLVLFLYSFLSRKFSSRECIILSAIFAIFTSVAYYTFGIISLVVLVSFILFFNLFRLIFRRNRVYNGVNIYSGIIIIVILSIIICPFFAIASDGALWKSVYSAIWGQISQIVGNDLFVYGNDRVYTGNTTAENEYSIYPTVHEPSRPEVVGNEPIKTAPSIFDKLFGAKFRSPLVRTALGFDFFDVTIYGKIFRVLQYLIQLSIIIGAIILVFVRKKVYSLYVFLVSIFVVMAVAYIILPVMSANIGATRFYHIEMIILSPVVIVGLHSIFWKIFYKYFSYATLTILFLYFVFTSGIVFELARFNNTDTLDIPYSIAISNSRMDIGGVFSDKDKEAAIFVRDTLSKGGVVFTDFYSTMIIADTMNWDHISDIHTRMLLIPWQTENMADGGFIYLRERSVNNRELSYYVDAGLRRITTFDEVDFDKALEGRELIFDNGARVYSPKYSNWRDLDLSFLNRLPIKIYNGWQCPICSRTYDIDNTGVYWYECSCGYFWRRQ